MASIGPVTTSSGKRRRSANHPSRVPAAWLVFVLGALNEILFGYDQGIIGVALLSIGKDFPIGPELKGLIVSSLLMGAAVAVAVAGRIADRVGRKPVLIAISAVFGVGGLVAAVAPNIPVLLAARVLQGFGIGASAVIVAVYLVEVAPTRHRGKVGALGQLAIVTGILLAYLTGYALQPSGQWRLMLGLTVIPAAALVGLLCFVPESPRWLVQQGRMPEARGVLARLGRETDFELEALARDVVLSQRKSVRTNVVLRRMLSPGLRRNTVAAGAICVLAQLIGTNSIIYFAPTTLIHAGFGSDAAVLANVAIGVCNLVFTFIGIALVDRVSRRKLLTAGAVGMTAAMTFLAVSRLLHPEASSGAAVVTLVSMIVFLSSFAFTWGISVRVVVAELYPSSIRSSAAGLTLVLQWVVNILVSQFFPTVLEASATLSFTIFAVVGVVAIAFVRRLLPESGSSRSLEEVAASTEAIA